MRKLISLLLIIGIFFATGCSFSSKPETTVSSFIDAGKKFDLAQMATMVNPSDSQKVTDMLKNQEGDKDSDYQKYFIDYFKENAAKITYSIKDSKVEKDQATVSVDFKYVDGGPLLKATLGDVFSKAISLAFSGVEMKDDEMSQMFVSSMTKQKETIKESMTEKTIDFNLKKVDNKWYISEPSDELLDVFMSNFLSVGNQINKSMNSNGNNADSEQTTFMDKAKKDNKIIITKAVGDEVILATINLKVNRVQEQANLSAKYSSPKTAKEGAKFVVVNLDITNTTNKAFTFEPNLLVIDNKGREFKPYSSIGSIDDYIDYKEISPSIKETGNMVFELPNDATSYNLVSGKSGTNEIYQIVLK